MLWQQCFNMLNLMEGCRRASGIIGRSFQCIAVKPVVASKNKRVQDSGQMMEKVAQIFQQKLVSGFVLARR